MGDFTIQLKAGEKLFINGALLVPQGRVSLVLKNAAQFIMAEQILKEENLVTPTDHLYFAIQECWMGTIHEKVLTERYYQYIDAIALDSEDVQQLNDKVVKRHYADALKILRVKRKEESNARNALYEVPKS